MADGAAEGALIGAAIGFVAVLVAPPITHGKERPQNLDKAEAERKISGKSIFISDTVTVSIPSDPAGYKKQAIPISAFAIKF